MSIDYALALRIIGRSDDPAAALEKFVRQQREVAAHKALTSVRWLVDDWEQITGDNTSAVETWHDAAAVLGTEIRRTIHEERRAK